MSNFSVNFSHPWLLFLLIPAVVILVVAIMRVPRKYRNTRNRVVSVTLEGIVLFCAIMILSGLTFTYTTGNTQNEILLLVDVTETMDSCAQQRDQYIEEILYRGEDEGCKVGIVTFGFTQVYAAPLSTDAEKVYEQYESAPLPDTTATDLASAMEYACKLYTNPETSKMVIISDGKETDQSAVSTLAMVSSQGTVVETVYIPSAYEGSDIQIVDVDMPDYHVSTGDTFEVSLAVESSYAGPISLSVTDNGEDLQLLDDNGNVEDGGRDLTEGSNTINFKCKVYDKYLHAIRITITDVDEEILTQNNTFCVYLYIDNYNKILIFQSAEGESEELIETLQNKTDEESSDSEEDPYDIIVLTLTEEPEDDLPLTVDELRQYDLIILNNTSNSDMYEAYRYYIEDRLDRMEEFSSYFYKSSGTVKSGGGLLPQLLYTYVYNYGGGLLTVGGMTEDEDGELVANMYSRSDMYGTVLQQMLPVTAINYTPPTGVVVVIDTSGSMGSGDGSLLSLAILGVLQSLDLLSTRDYMGIIEFSSEPHIVMSLTSLTNKSYIQASLNSLLENPQSQGTVLAPSLSQAVTMLETDKALYERKHIIVVTDGILSDTESCWSVAQTCLDDDISLSAIVVGGGSEGLANMSSIVEIANAGVTDGFLYDCSSGESEKMVGQYIYDDIQATVWAEVNYEEVQIQIGSGYTFSSLTEGLFATYDDGTTDWDHLDASLTRFYGTTIKSGASLVLTGDYSVPIYAQWSYGEGMVGSFMGDLHDYGDLGGNKLIIDENSPAGRQFIINIVDNLMPTEDIRPNGVSVTLTEDNYTNRLSLYADMEDEEGNPYTVDARIFRCDGDEEIEVLNLGVVTSEDEIDEDTLYYVTVAMDESNNYSRANFVIKESGVYKIVVQLLDVNGDVVENEMHTPATATVYKKFSYSAEYDNFNAGEGLALMNALSTGETGGAITDSDELVYVYSGLVTRITKTVDPRLPLIIAALVLFLLGIAVRKFKWKWPHEIVRDRRLKKSEENKFNA